MSSAAFFDLDRTLLRRSSALALAGSFRERGLIGRGQLAKAAAWQLLFVARGASAETVRKASEDGMRILTGFPVDELRDLVAGAMEPVLKPLVYREPLRLLERHREQGEPVYIVSATLQEIVDELARELGFDGAIGSTCEIADGVYTGRVLRPCHGAGKAAAVRELAEREGIDLTASTAYSDSHTDLPFLEVVGEPGRGQSRQGAAPGGSRARLADPVVRRARLSGRQAPLARPHRDPARARGRRRAPRRQAPCGLTRPARGSPRSASHADDVELLFDHFDDAERRGKLGHGHARIEWLETQAFDPAATPVKAAGDGLDRWESEGAVGYLVLAAVCADVLAERRPVRLVAADAFPTGHLGYWVRRLAEGGLVAALTATSPPRLAHPDGGAPLVGTNPLAIGIPSADGAADRRRRLDGEGDVRRRARGPSAGPRTWFRSAATRRTRRSRSPSACRGSSSRSSAPATASSCSRPSRRTSSSRTSCAGCAGGLRLPGDA